MAQVPYTPFPTVAPIGAPGNDLQRIQNPEETYHGYLGQGEERIGAAEQGAGGALERGGEALDRGAANLQSFADQRQQQTNELYANDASTQGMQNLTKVWEQYNTLTGRAAHDAWPDYQKQLKQAYDQTLAAAPNEQAKVLLSNSMKQMTDRYMMAGQSYADSQWRSWYNESALARGNELSNQAVVARQDPSMMDKLLAAGVDEAMKPLDASGATQDQKTAAAARYIGVTVKNVVLSKIEDGDVAGANALLQQYGSKMDAASQIEAQKVLAPKIREINATAIANAALKPGSPPPKLLEAPGSLPSHFTTGISPAGEPNTLLRAIAHGESGGDGDYNSVFGDGRYGTPDKPVTQLTINEAIQWADRIRRNPQNIEDGNRAGPLGKYQFVGSTIRSLRDQMGLSGNELFNPQMQDAFAWQNLKNTGGNPQRIREQWVSWAGKSDSEIRNLWAQGMQEHQAFLDRGDTVAPTAAVASSDLPPVAGSKDRGDESAPGVAQAPQDAGMPDKSAAMTAALNMAGSDPELQKAAVAAVNEKYTQFNIQTATERQGLEATVPNLIQDAEAGVDGIQIPEDRIRAVMPPAKAQAWIDEFHIAQQGGQIIKGLRFSSTADWQAAGQDLTSGQGVLSNMMKAHAKYATSGPGAMGATADNDEGNAGYLRLREGIGRQFMTQFMERNKMLYGTDADPAAYVHDEPNVTAARASADPQNPASMEAYANSVLGVQTHLGVPDAAQHVLTRDDAQQMATKIMAPGMDAKTALDGLQRQYGGAYQHVFNDMVTLGKLPASFQSVQALDDPHDAALLSRAINETRPGSDGKAKDWNDILGNAGGQPIANVIKDSVRNDPNITSFQNSLAKSGASLGQIDGITQSVETLAYAKRFYEGEDPASAAADAVKSFTGKFEYMPNGGARVPSDMFDAVSNSAGTMLKNLSSDNIAIPPVFGQTGAPSQQEYIDTLAANPTWITAPKGNALWLMDNGGRLVRTKDGQPVQVPFSNTPLPAHPASLPPNGQAPSTSQNDNSLLIVGTANGG